MSRRQGRSAEKSTGRADADRGIIERLIEKKQYKDALKQARLGFRQNGSPENRQLLERASCLRIEELARRGLLVEAKEVLEKALEVGALDASALANLAGRAPQLGLAPKAGTPLAPDCDELAAGQVDGAVLRPNETPASMAEELCLGAERIRASLAALEGGDESQALELLQDIPRGSPLADWRYFVRGLAAFRRGAGEQAIANWERLDCRRSAFSIARLLRRAIPPSATVRDAGNSDVSLIEVAVFSEPVLGRLERLQVAVDENDWGQAVKLLSGVSASLRRADVALARRLTQAMLEPLAREAINRSFERGQRLVREFTRVAEPLPLDPNWNRFWALLWERSEGDFAGAIEHWRLYIQDLERIASPLPVERRRLQALVWRHIAELLLEEESPAGEFGPVRRYARSAAGEDRLDRADTALRRSLKLDPSQLATHNMLIKACLDNDRPDLAAEAARELLQAFPEDLAALRTLIGHHTSRDEPEEALSYLRRARALKPLDETLVEDEWAAHLALARRHALAKRWDEGRAQFAAAEALPVDRYPPFWLLAHRIVFEFMANQSERAEELTREAKAKLEEPTALWLLVAIEAARYKAPKAVLSRFQEQWRTALKKKTSSQTAGVIADTLLAYAKTKTDIPNGDRILGEATSYLARTTRIKYREPDLAAVCRFLIIVGDEGLLTEKLVRRGSKQFPKSAIFPYLAAQHEIGKGPMSCDPRHAKRLLKKALDSAKSPDSVYGSLIPEIQRRLLDVEDLVGELDRFPFRPSLDENAMPSFFEMMNAMLNGRMAGDDGPDDDGPDDDGPDDDRAFENMFGRPRRRPAGRGKRGKKAAEH